MFTLIKSLLQQISHHQQQHKLTIFNKQRNFLNMHLHNITEGKLLQQLRKFDYFRELNQVLGSSYLLRMIQFLDTDLLRKTCVLVDSCQNKRGSNDVAEFLLCEGVVSVYEVDSLGDGSSGGGATFREYISNGAHISFAEYPQSGYKLIAHTDCQFLKLPTKQQLDPSKQLQKIHLNHQSFAHRPQFIENKNRVMKFFNEMIKKNHHIDCNLGLSQVDFLQLLGCSKIQNHKAHETLYRHNETINYIGLIMKGKAVSQDTAQRSKKVIGYDNAILTFYKKDYSAAGSRLQKNESLIQENEWFGLSQYLRHIKQRPFRLQNNEGNNKIIRRQDNIMSSINSFGQIRVKQDCVILWVPLMQFAVKFNYQVAFSIVDKWQARMQIGYEAREKRDRILEKLQVSVDNDNTISNADQITLTPSKQQLGHQVSILQHLGHNWGKLSSMRQARGKLISDWNRRKRQNSQTKTLQISQTSLLGITMRSRQKLQVLKQSQISQSQQDRSRVKVFSHCSRSSKQEAKANAISNRKKLSVNSGGITRNRGDSQGVNSQGINKIVMSQRKINLSSYTIDVDAPQELIMYPEAYEPSKLSPDLRKQMFQAQKTWRLQSLRHSPKNTNAKINFKSSRLPSLDSNHSIVDNKSTRLSSMASKLSLNHSITTESTPTSLYRKITEMVAYKYPQLDQKLRLEKFMRKRNHIIERVSLKEKIQTLKVLEEIEKKKRVRERRQLKEIIVRQVK